MVGVAASVQNTMQKHAALLAGVLTHKERRAIASFVQAPEDYFDAEPSFKQSYAPASGEIFGILKQMKETFENNLSASQKEEMANQKAYEDLWNFKTADRLFSKVSFICFKIPKISPDWGAYDCLK